MADKSTSKKRKINKHNTRFEKTVTPSTRYYLERQVRDPYSNKAREEGYRSRAVYKLSEINDKYNLIKQGQIIVDLGAAPGSWSQMAARIMQKNGTVIALDKIEIDTIDGVKFLLGDFTEDKCLDALLKITPKGVDIVLSDMAPETSGTASVDHLRIMGLAELAADFAERTLKPGGSFICKLFMGGGEKAFSVSLRKQYNKVNFIKPSASRADSKEIFIVARDFKG